MINKIRAAVIAACLTLLVSLGIVATTVAPAHAVSTGAVCKQGYHLKACVTITFVAQNVVITSVGHSTASGCGNLGSPRYVYKQASTSNKYYNWGGRDCGQVEATYDACSGCTTRGITVYLKANVQGDFDTEFTFEFSLRSNGSWAAWTSYYEGPCC